MMGGCYVGKGAGAHRSVGRPAFLHSDAADISSVNCFVFAFGLIPSWPRLHCDGRSGCEYTYTPRRPLDVG